MSYDGAYGKHINRFIFKDHYKANSLLTRLWKNKYFRE